MLTLAIQAGLRVSELTALNCGDIHLGTGAHVRCEGKGRKQRTVPLTLPVQTTPARLADRTRRPTNGAAVRDPNRPAAQPRRDRATSRTARRRRRGQDARRCTASSYTHTSCGTAARCHCCKPASIPPSSRSG